MPSPVLARMESALELPGGLLTGGVHIELTDRREALVEGCRRIDDYADDRVVLETGGGTVRITGSELCLARTDKTTVTVTGSLLSVEFL